MLSKVEKGQLQGRIARDARALRLSNATVAWFLDRATPGQMQAVSELLSHELEVRSDSRHARLLRQAKFPAVKSASAFDPSDLRFQEGYGWEQLLGLEWLGQSQDFVFHGPTGRGKTHLAIALGMLAIDAGKSARFLSCAQLVFDLKVAKERGRLDVYITKTGECYHRDGCSSLRKSKIPISVSDAQARGYRPCKNCNP